MLFLHRICPPIWGCWGVSPAALMRSSFCHQFFGIREFSAGQKEKQLQLLCVSSAMGWPRSGSPEIGSQNLMHDHQVFQGITKECCEANPLCNTLQCCRRQMAPQCYWFPSGFEPSPTSQRLPKQSMIEQPLQAPKTTKC